MVWRQAVRTRVSRRQKSCTPPTKHFDEYGLAVAVVVVLVPDACYRRCPVASAKCGYTMTEQEREKGANGKLGGIVGEAGVSCEDKGPC